MLRYVNKIDSKFIKGLYDMNQDSKYIFTRYILDINGNIISVENKSNKGIHFATTNYKLLDGNLGSVLLDSEAIFKAIQNNKKNIESIQVVKYVIYLSGTDSYAIGCVSDEYQETKIPKNLLSNSNRIAQFILTDDEVISLVNNAYITLNEGNYSTRITKELIPGLKKKHDVEISFFSIPNNTDLFDVSILCKRDTITSNHIYRCIKL